MTCSLSSFEKYADDAPLMLRIVLGAIFMYAGLMKVFEYTAEGFAQSLNFLPFPLFWAWIVIVVEVIGGLFLILGLWVRWTSIFAAINMAVATGVTWATMGASMITTPLACFAIAIALLILGAGAWSLEKAAFDKEC
jgi:putative oxidoreductase